MARGTLAAKDFRTRFVTKNGDTVGGILIRSNLLCFCLKSTACNCFDKLKLIKNHVKTNQGHAAFDPQEMVQFSQA